MAIHNINQYLTYIRILVRESGCCKIEPAIVADSSKTNLRQGIVSATPLVFKDGGVMKFYEDLIFDGKGNIQRQEYSIGYAPSASDKDLFRYEKDPNGIKPIVHEECHLHVLGAMAYGKRMRFKTHETNFEEVFAFVVAMYYAR